VRKDVDAEEVEAEALRRKKLEAKANSEAFNFLRSRKHFSQNVGQRCGSVVNFLWKRKHFEENLLAVRMIADVTETHNKL